MFCYSVIKVLCRSFLWHNFFILSYSEVFVKNFFNLFFNVLLLFLSNSYILSHSHSSVKHFFIFLLYFPNKSEKYYGEGGIWTLAPRERSTPLAGAPLQPLEYFSMCLHTLILKLCGGESGIRTHGTLTRTPVFKTGALNQLDHLSSTMIIISVPLYKCQHFFQLFFIFFRIWFLLSFYSIFLS